MYIYTQEMPLNMLNVTALINEIFFASGGAARAAGPIR